MKLTVIKTTEKWRLDDDKLTFIILYKSDDSNLSSGETVYSVDPRITLLPMVGDVNIFLHGNVPPIQEGRQVTGKRGENDEQEDFEAEVEIMIAGKKRNIQNPW